MAITYQDGLILPDYLAIRGTTDWQTLGAAQAARSLDGTLYGITVFDDDVPVGMARMVGDGGYIYIIVDVVVIPQYQGRGIGRGLLERLIAYTKGQVSGEEFILLHLMSVKGKEKFYEKFGFLARPNETSGPGMHQYIRADQ